jgi:hypothetical protein
MLKDIEANGGKPLPWMVTDETYIRMIPDKPGYLYCRREHLERQANIYKFVKFGKVQAMFLHTIYISEWA